MSKASSRRSKPAPASVVRRRRDASARHAGGIQGAAPPPDRRSWGILARRFRPSAPTNRVVNLVSKQPGAVQDVVCVTSTMSTEEGSAGYVEDGERESFLGRGEAEPQMAPPSHRILHHAPAYMSSPP